jgi:hypothetical protein
MGCQITCQFSLDKALAFTAKYTLECTYRQSIGGSMFYLFASSIYLIHPAGREGSPEWP